MSKFCTNCGSPIEETTTVCLKCGVLAGNKAQNNNLRRKKKGLPTWTIVLIVVGSVLIVPVLLMVIGGFVAYKTLSTSSQSIIESQFFSTTKELTSEIINEESLDGLTVDSITLDRDEVIIKGTEEEIDKVVTVKAIINLENIDNVQDGNNFIDDITLVAYDELGNKVDVEIVPNKISATIAVSLNSANVKVKIIPTGTLAYGKAISSLTTSINTITIYGAEETINEYNNSYIPVQINVDGLSEDKTFTVDIDKPTGINKMSQKNITIEVKLGEAEQKEIENIMIEAKGLRANLKASAIEHSQTSISIIVTGVSEVLENISQENIKALVDLTGLGVGEHTVSIEVIGDNNLVTYMPKTTAIKLRISES